MNVRDGIRQTQAILDSNELIRKRGWSLGEAEEMILHRVKAQSGQVWRRSDLYFEDDFVLSDESWEGLVDLARKRASGEPLHYLLGQRSFLEHEFTVEPGVLIPRPETEFLVSEMIERLGPSIKAIENPVGLEIGVGSGVISVSLLSRFPDLKMWATETSEVAERVTMANATRILGEKRIKTGLKILKPETSLEVFEPFHREIKRLKRKPHVAFIVSNPPYLHSEDPMDMEVVDREPHEALFPFNGDPLWFYKQMSKGLRSFAEWNDGKVPPLVIEIPSFRAGEIQKLFAGFQVEKIRDLADEMRVLIVTG